MSVVLDKIEQLPNGAAHLVFFTDVSTNFISTLSFTIPKAFASTACRYIVENAFCYGTKLDISIVPLSDGREMMEITSYSSIGNSKNVLRITQYTRDKHDKE